ncbi:FG-GAP-like repeat-containing protein [Nocardioides jiangxiensis]|uniref:FG-GAP-like repeat-containing protein n=1 Tax=Nocardioides jiangxiensis TaxID=3064524 RepID=A0ABT9AYJ6_9ACTN|nr:FG-GAP-like repeat-containing protein [Nocardioides sp. WY-20]MDO7867487.1 FG-GAP-like repeat-containing protein [Nocardioides sp. WY-20]
MRLTKTRFVTVCQQALIVGTAFAVLGPAADVISLDVVTQPDASAQHDAGVPVRGGKPAPTARVETAPVEAKVTAVPVDEKAAAPAHTDVPRGGEVVQTAPHAVDGFGTVGVTWKPGTQIDEKDITVQARTSKDGTWSGWTTVHYDEGEGPDPGSPDALHARPGTDPLIVGDVDQVQTRVVTAPGVTAPDLEMAVVAPGASSGTEVEKPAITAAGGEALSTSHGDISLQADTITPAAGTTTVPRPTIYSRAQWGADESWRKAAPLYGNIAAGFIHHTVNANDYTADQVPGIIRSIYAYHTKTKGWNDIGYNFLIDRFGRIWEGRYGGVDKDVVPAATQGYNSYSFAASAIGNYEEAQPSSATLDAYARLYAWKLALKGIAADDTSQYVGSRYFQAINGHRDAGQTACPGKYLYAQIPGIRTAARKYQLAGASATPTTSPSPTTTATPTPTPVTGTPRVPNLAGASYPDLAARRASDGEGVVLPTGGLLSFSSPVAKGTGWSRYDVKVLSPDLTGDGRADMLVRIASTGTAGVRPGAGDGTFGRAVAPVKTFVGYDRITAAGRFNGDGFGDLVGRSVATGNLVLFKGDGAGHFTKTAIASGFGDVTRLVVPGDITGDGHPDVLARTTSGRLYRYDGDGHGAVGPGTRIGGTWDYPVLAAAGDLTGDGLNDLLVRTGAGTVAAAPGTGAGGFGPLVPMGGSLGGLSGVGAAQVVGTAAPDAIGFDGDSLVLVPNSGRTNVGRPIDAGVTFRNANQVLNVGDWDGDGKGDVITRYAANGYLVLYRGLGNGKLAPGATIDKRNFNSVTMLTAAGDVTGDGKPDLIANKDGQLVAFAGNGGTAALSVAKVLNSTISGSALLDLGRWDSGGTLDTGVLSSTALGWLPSNTGTPRKLAADLSGLTGVIGAGDLTGDGRRDLVGRSGSRLWLLPGVAGGFGTRRYLGAGYAGYDLLG